VDGRDAALSAVRGHLTQALEHPDEQSILVPQALADAERLAAAADPADDPAVAYALGLFHWFRYVDLPAGADQDDLAAAVRLFEPLFRSDPDSVPTPLRRLFLRKAGESKDMDVGAGKLTGRALAAMRAYESTGQIRSLEESVEFFRAAVEATDLGDPDRATCLNNLGLAVRTLFERTDREDLLSEAVAVGRQVVAGTADDHPDRGTRLSNLAGSVQSVFERTGDPAALNEAVVLLRAAVEATAATHEDHAGLLGNLGLALLTTARRTGDRAVLAEGVDLVRTAFATTPLDDPERARRATNLAVALQMSFEQTGVEAELREAVATLRSAADLTPIGHPDRARHLSNAGIGLRMLFQRTGDAGVLAEAITASREAADTTPVDHPDRPGRLSNLALVLRTQFEATGQSDTLAASIEAARQAVATTPADHPDRAARLNNLSLALRTLYEWTGREDALTEASEFGREALSSVHGDDPDRGTYLSSVGGILQALYERAGQEAALLEAVEKGREAVARTPADHPDRAGRLNNLGLALLTLSGRTGHEHVLTEAVETARRAVTATDRHHPAYGPHLSNLGLALQAQYRHTGREAALTDAITAGREAVEATPVDHPDRALYLSNLATGLQALSERTGQADAERSIVVAEARIRYAEAARNENARPIVRIGAYSALAALPALSPDAEEQSTPPPPDELAAVEAAVGLLPLVTPRTLARSDREHGLGRLGPLAALAAATAVAAGLPERAVELLEQARGVLVADTLDARGGDLVRLRAYSSTLADRCEKLRAAVDVPDLGGNVAGGVRQQAHTEWDAFVAEVRRIGGFEDFLGTPGIETLSEYACSGPIVMVTTSGQRSTALILTGDTQAPVRALPLVGITEDDAVRQAERLLAAQDTVRDPDAGAGASIAAQADIREVLAWLWDHVAGPVLDTLGYKATPADDEPWPRVWWCPVGVLAFLPLHAAGHHDDPDAGPNAEAPGLRAVLDRVVSSYTATARALAYSRVTRPPDGTRTTTVAADQATTLIIAAADAPGSPWLSGVTKEADSLADLIPGSRVLADPTGDAVLATLADHAVVHFACHGYTDWANPAASSLALHDHDTAPLTVTDISALQLNGDLAFLAACETTATAPALANEAVHITGAFHLAGYAHVIGTLWPVDDATTAELALDFYRRLTADGHEPPDADHAPRALHDATRRLRDRYPMTPTLWAAYTHTGI
jgi:hypothetical protein